MSTTDNSFTYVYQNPMDKGAIQKFSLSREQHKELIGNALPLTPFECAEYYRYPDKIEVLRFTTALGKTLELMLSPLFIILHGVFEWKRMVSSLIHERNQGHFCTTTIWKRGASAERFEKLESIALNQIK